MNYLQAVFGYGSLANCASLEQTLGRSAGRLDYAWLQGWRRDWSVVVRNESAQGWFELLDGARPEVVLALNLVADEGMGVNGVLAGVSDAELAELDTRETHYDRVEVTKQVVCGHRYGRVWAYVGKPAHGGNHSAAVVPASYRELVEAGFREHAGELGVRVYRWTTAPAPAPIAATVFREAEPSLFSE